MKTNSTRVRKVKGWMLKGYFDGSYKIEEHAVIFEKSRGYKSMYTEVEITPVPKKLSTKKK